jgi:hypothetical protein
MRIVCCIIVLTITPLFAAGANADSWEQPGTFKASQILTPQQRKGEHHQVAEKVTVKGFHYAYVLHTDFGELQPVGLDILRKRIQETAALEALNEMSKSDVFLDAAGRSLKSMGDGTVHLAKDPVETLHGIGSGIKRSGINLGRKSKRALSDRKDDEHEHKLDGQITPQEAESVVYSTFDVNNAARSWARKLEVDPYSRNPLLQKALIKIAQIDTAGKMATKIVVPMPTLASATEKVGDLVWDEDPEALHKRNEAGLTSLGVSGAVAEQFYSNDNFTLTDRTRFISALVEVKAQGLADYVDAARRADNRREAIFFVESAEMMVRQHAQDTVSAVLTDSRSMVALSGGRALALYPVNYLYWNQHVAEVTAEIAGRVGKELGTSEIEIHLTGRVSERARVGLEAQGWILKQGVSDGVVPN